MQRLICLLLLLPFFAQAQTIGYRKYIPGEILKYELTTTVYRNDKFSSRSVAVSEHRVVKDTGLFIESIHWLSKKSFTTKDTSNLDTVARKVAPYRLSLSPEGKVLLPKLAIPEMVGDITDLNTFYVAIAPALNVQKLSLQNKSVANAELRQGNFADSIVILYGTDCIRVTQNLLELTKEYAVVQTKFMPPASFCLVPLLDTVGRKSFDEFNNIQMIQKGAEGKVNVFWGVEHFTITTKIDLSSGKILHAVMDNDLSLRMRYNTSPDLTSYAVEMPVTIKRRVELDLIR